MNPFLFRLLCMACFISLAPGLRAQDEPQTIRVKRESNLSKAVFDNTEFRLMVIDRFGNPRENKIVSYKLWIKGRGTTREMNGFSNNLTGEMINALKKQSKAVKIFFTDISAQDDEGHLTPLPDVIEVWFPDCENCENPRRNNR